MSKFCFGVDVGGTTVKLGLFTAEGELKDSWEIPTHVENNGEKIIPDIADAILAKMAVLGINKEDVLGIGVGVPGPVDKDGVVHRAVNLGWGNIELSKELNGLTGMKVVGGNDANVAALGEQWKGGGQGYNDMVLITLGTGVGGGIIVNGKIVVGDVGAAGEIGHVHIEDDEEQACNCGNYGCLEQYASATGIVRLANRRLAADNTESVLRSSEVSAKTVFDAVKEGDKLAMEVAEEFGRYLGKGLAMIGSVLNPKAIVIGGGVSKAGDVLISYIQKYYKQYAFHASKEVVFTLATLGNAAGIYGAAKLVVEE